MPKTLVTTSELAEHLGHLDWVTVDCRFQLNDLKYGRRAYEQAHIAGAVYANLNEDLSGPIVPGVTSRHPLPTVETAARTFSERGIAADTQVVAYDDQAGALAAARLWWMLRWLGHEAVAVLDGGWPKWEMERRPVRSGNETRSPRTFIPHVRPGLLVDSDDVLRTIGDPSHRLIDVRSPERYRGESEPIDPVAGHIPGAVSAPYLENLTTEGTFKPVEELRPIYQALIDGLSPGALTFYCGSGVTAPHGILAMLHAGLGEARLYAGSWSEWITNADRPIETDS
jgi:thiosulfate/3-mercaptopyruvate sulfurtransferase